MSTPTPKPGFLRRTLPRVFRVLLVLLIAIGIGVWFGWRWFDREILSTLPSDLSEYREWRPPTACQVFDAKDQPIDQFYVERRIWVPLSELDPWTWQAFIAAEDRRFMEHPGVDLLGIARAMWVNTVAGRDIQGASTITQQLVKNLIVGKERSYTRKLKEAVLAWRLEQELSKEQILELYVNYIALGSGNYGVEAAAQDYFGISARDLDPGQAALLAGLVPAPSRYSPRSDPEQAARRRELVLGGMVQMGFLSAEQIPEFLAAPVLIEKEPPSGPQAGAAYITQVRREVRRLLGDEIPFQRGLQVYTPYDAEVQKTAEQAIQQALRDLEDRQGRRGAVRRISPERWEKFLARSQSFPRDPNTLEVHFPKPGACFETLVGPTGDLGILRAGSWYFQLKAEDRRAMVRDTSPEGRPRPLASTIGAGDVLRVCLESGEANFDGQGELPIVRLDSRPWAEGAAVVLENKTGNVIALVGGYNVGLEGFVRATQARRQPGSSFKPYVYATALLEGYTQTDMVLDAPIALPGASGSWSPQNYTGGYAGNLPMRTALAKSLNTVSVRLILDVGTSDVVKTARSMGVSTPLRRDLTIALGSSEVTPMDQALGYATIARMGVATEPVFISRLEDVRHELVARAGEPVMADDKVVALLPGGPGKQVLPPGIAYELADMMRAVVQQGTARKARKAGFDRAGKTGTTNDFLDAWYVGFTPRYTIAVWVGTDGTTSLGDQETGGKTALPAWITIADTLPDVEGERFPIPDGATLVRWNGDWIGLPSGQIPERVLATDAVGEAPLPSFPGTNGN